MNTTKLSCEIDSAPSHAAGKIGLMIACWKSGTGRQRKIRHGNKSKARQVTFYERQPGLCRPAALVPTIMEVKLGNQWRFQIGLVTSHIQLCAKLDEESSKCQTAATPIFIKERTPQWLGIVTMKNCFGREQENALSYPFPWERDHPSWVTASQIQCLRIAGTVTTRSS